MKIHDMNRDIKDTILRGGMDKDKTIIPDFTIQYKISQINTLGDAVIITQVTEPTKPEMTVI